ncbi:protein of unknown function (plasmid) [Cupriavidus neocaledonicus]|uniref:Uncharacterized protein n=1 Tax=Cupriavidus neocaledonicus TaxID=1040979 RepID=A0A375HS01_9BURK|nr:hypothetical protein CBM2605_B40051 [Cupriavidus neocaledonicus]SPD60949.1 protein of unknown function [Cupriavidus neocaledonicus]
MPAQIRKIHQRERRQARGIGIGAENRQAVLAERLYRCNPGGRKRGGRRLPTALIVHVSFSEHGHAHMAEDGDVRLADGADRRDRRRNALVQEANVRVDDTLLHAAAPGEQRIQAGSHRGTDVGNRRVGPGATTMRTQQRDIEAPRRFHDLLGQFPAGIDHGPVLVEPDTDRQSINLFACARGIQQHRMRFANALACRRRDAHRLAVGNADDGFRRSVAAIELHLGEGGQCHAGRKCGEAQRTTKCENWFATEHQWIAFHGWLNNFWTKRVHYRAPERGSDSVKTRKESGQQWHGVTAGDGPTHVWRYGAAALCIDWCRKARRSLEPWETV